MRILTLESLIFVTGGQGRAQERSPQLVDQAQLKQQQQHNQPYRPASPYFNFWK